MVFFAMKQTQFASPTRQTKSDTRQKSTVGKNTVAFAPRPYGIASVDRGNTATPTSSPPVQLQGDLEEEELLQGKFDPVQRQDLEEEELLQGQFANSVTPMQFQASVEPAANRTGMPDPLKAGLEQLSGLDMSGVRVQYNSARPAQLGALAYAQGQNIEVSPGQERHLPHEAWHVVQQMQGRVKSTTQVNGVAINNDPVLEREADVMGAKSLQQQQFGGNSPNIRDPKVPNCSSPPVQRQPDWVTERIEHRKREYKKGIDPNEAREGRRKRAELIRRRKRNELLRRRRQMDRNEPSRFGGNITNATFFGSQIKTFGSGFQSEKFGTGRTFGFPSSSPGFGPQPSPFGSNTNAPLFGPQTNTFGSGFQPVKFVTGSGSPTFGFPSSSPGFGLQPSPLGSNTNAPSFGPQTNTFGSEFQPVDFEDNQAALKMAAQEVASIIKGVNDTLELEEHFDYLQNKYGLTDIGFEDLGTERARVVIKINPEFEIKLVGSDIEMRAEGTGAGTGCICWHWSCRPPGSSR